MIKILNRLFCKHEKVLPVGTILVKQEDGSWKTEHKWKCRKCGKVIKSEKN